MIGTSRTNLFLLRPHSSHLSLVELLGFDIWHQIYFPEAECVCCSGSGVKNLDAQDLKPIASVYVSRY